MLKLLTLKASIAVAIVPSGLVHAILSAADRGEAPPNQR
jgi:hypothetical protein